MPSVVSRHNCAGTKPTAASRKWKRPASTSSLNATHHLIENCQRTKLMSISNNKPESQITTSDPKILASKRNVHQRDQQDMDTSTMCSVETVGVKGTPRTAQERRKTRLVWRTHRTALENHKTLPNHCRCGTDVIACASAPVFVFACRCFTVQFIAK